jgi:N-acetylglucosaminyldiphosphoundecaprenol N-acetyl-beta-D-mannosaminyltransferase
MQRANETGGKCFFLGSSPETLEKIQRKASIEYPNAKVFSYSPPYKNEFDVEDNEQMIKLINAIEPDVLFVGMTAPKQEKWAFQHFSQMLVGHVCCIGAVFDFYAGTIQRAPKWMIQLGIEWLYRLIKEPRRLWRRYLIGNTKFLGYILIEKLKS